MKYVYLIFVAALVPAGGCDDPCHSPLVVDSPQIAISDVVATHNRVSLKITPKNAVSISYALLSDAGAKPAPEDFVTVETVAPATVSIPHLERDHTYRIFAYSSSGVYPGEMSAVVSETFTTQLPVCLSDAGTANCYVVPAIGCYMFDWTVRGCGDEPTGDVVRLETLWTDSSNLLTDFSFDEDDPRMAVFATRATTGNAVVAARDADGRILWSWHIWCCNGTPGTDLCVDAGGVAHTMMDRNLGAPSTAAATCMLYQWGRKDPFPNFNGLYAPADAPVARKMEELFEPVLFDETGDLEARNLRFVVSNPATFLLSRTNADVTDAWFGRFDAETTALWGDPAGADAARRGPAGWSGEKSVYDPCPPGYRVPNRAAYTGFSLEHVVGAWDGGWMFRRTADDAVGTRYPVTGWRLTHTGAVNATSPESGRIVHWYSCPDAAGTRMLRLFSHKTACNTSHQVFTSMAAAVRCEKIR